MIESELEVLVGIPYSPINYHHPLYLTHVKKTASRVMFPAYALAAGETIQR